MYMHFHDYHASWTCNCKVDIVKGEAERQRLQREELETELHTVKHQMQNVENVDADMKRSGAIISNILLIG